MSKYPPIYYSDYLQLEKLLGSQKLKSEEYGHKAHEEMLFIIVHQAYELWFKQILHEVDSINQMFKDDIVDERSIGIAVSRLHRITEIQKLLVEQLRVLETMTPLDFLEFRDFLIPASGFQSFQFRLIENKLGLSDEKRIQYNNVDYLNTLEEVHRKLILETVKNPSMFELVEKWLERTPFLNAENFSFWGSYKQAVEKMLEHDKNIIMENKTLTEKKREFQLKQIELTRQNYEALFDEKKHNELVKEGKIHLSNKAMLAAIFINLYRDEPILHMPFMLLNHLVEMDERFTEWRYRHALMVHRMIGAKIGTGGSSGHQYLMATVDKHRIFTDLFNLSTYLIPRSELPRLPDDLVKLLGFSYTNQQKRKQMTIDLSGKNAVVCGSTQGIGKAIALQFAECGASVVLVARNEEALRKVLRELSASKKQNHSFIVADFSDPDTLKKKMHNFTSENPPVHILVNNTGGPKSGEAHKALTAEFEEAFRNHLICNQILVQSLVEDMKKEKYGRILNIISTSVKQPIKNLGVSNTIRAAVANWAKTLSVELAPFGITVNNILPGATKTERLYSLFEARSKASGKPVEEVKSEWLVEIPAGRFAEPEEPAYAAAFLASPLAGYINGINLPVDGGRLNCL